MTLKLHTSNRMEVLVKGLSKVVSLEKLPPLESEVIVVQSQGLARFLSMELANQHGVWAGGEFPFPNAFLQNLFSRVLGEDISGKGWQRGPLAWRIYTLLPLLLSQPGFEVVASFCATPEKQFGLSLQVSDLFDQYVLYRPEMITRWSLGEDASWQAVLWRRLEKDIAAPHRAELFANVIRQLAKKAELQLPKRVILFGLSSMPPLMIEVFSALAAHIDVHIFFLNPCQHEWSHIMTSGAITRVELATGQGREEQFLESGNDLLASMGHLGRDFFDLLLQHHADIREEFVYSDTETVLATIQNDILDLKNSEGGQELDDSIKFISCHTGMREVEVLLDHLLHLFNDNADLAPHDILVMAPDIGIYAPLIDAVFRDRDLTYAIADQSMQEQECFVGIMALVKAATGRWRVSEIMALLEIPVISRRFELGDDDLGLIRQWLVEVRIHWGRDKHHRAELGLPPSPEYSFRQGINRLLLGFAMEGDDLFMGMLPFQGPELDGDVAGKFLLFYERLLALSSLWQGDKNAAKWSVGLLAVVSDFFAPTPEQEWEINQLRTIFDSLMQDAELACCQDDLAPEVILTWLKKALNLDRSPYGFLSGGITFCSLLPMRAIPAKVVCLLGMNEADFPRSQVYPGFDLMAREYKKGDRLKRNDDRYLFLEALLSAREQLYISFVGRSVIDNREILPSVLVCELLEYLQPLLGKNDTLVVEQPLQPFNPDYFNTTLPRSFSEGNYKACTAFMGTSEPGLDFLADLKIKSTPSVAPLPLSDLLRFWKNPAAFFCLKTLGLAWDSLEPPLVDDEPFSLFGLDKYQVANECVALLLKDESPRVEHIRAMGILPHGVSGELAFSEVVNGCRRLVERVQEKQGTPCANIQECLTCGDVLLDISLESLTSTGQVVMRFGGKIDGRHIIESWLKHLLLQGLDVPAEKTTYLIGVDEIVTFAPLANSFDLLEDLLKLYQLGLCQPLPFFAKASWRYMHKTVAKNAEAGLVEAMKEFDLESHYYTPESAHPAIQRCFSEYRPDSDFTKLAHRVFDPVFDVVTLELSKK